MAKSKRKSIMALFLTSFLLVSCAGEKDFPMESSSEEQYTHEELIDEAQAPAEGNVSSKDESLEGTNEVNQESFEYTIKVLAPFEQNTHKIYEGKGGEYIGYEEYVDFIKDDKIQLRMNNGGTEIVRILERKDGELVEVFSQAEIYYVENFLSKKTKGTRVLLKEPIVLGMSWINAGVETSTITNLKAEVKTALGTYTAVEVTRESKDEGVTYKTIDYYAPEMGLIKTINEGSGYTSEATLEVYEKDVEQKKVMNFYYPNIDDDRLFLYKKEIAFKTNDIPRNLFLEAYKILPKEAGMVLTENTKVNYLYLNDDGRVYIDLSKDFIGEMNAGAGFESLILQSLANTFGDYYGAKNVMLTIEGEPYESGHILLEEFEPISVNYKSILNMN